ncbi:MAG: AmmeMemoRadiSam system radical SAM enzyme [Cellulosilyticaceae bacterium]
MRKLAQFFSIQEGRVKCGLCPHRCFLEEGERGKCGVRGTEREKSGKLRLYTYNYGDVTSIALDPIEKKPLKYFCPGTQILSIGSFGCNLSCQFCQNHGTAHGTPKSKAYSPRDVVDILKRFSDSVGIAFTYNEPAIWYEFVYDTAVALKKALPEKKVVLVTNGYINEEPLRKLLPYIDAMNIDLKGDERFYEEICSGILEPVRQTIAIAKEEGVHVEVTTLLVGEMNSAKEQLLEIGSFLRDVDPEIPLHLTRYSPNYKMTLPPTELAVMKESYELLRVILPHIEIGNVTEHELQSMGL